LRKSKTALLTRTLVAEALGWAPQVMLDDGLPLTVDYFRRSCRGGGGDLRAA
jgi:hypothetical protein